MAGLGCFQTAVCGMNGQSHALGVIGANIANVTTGGYKRTDTGFRTLLSDTVAFHPGNPDAAGPASIQSDLGGMRASDTARISEAGEYTATGRDLDVAVAGRGFFVLNSGADGAGATAYGRDGQLAVATVGAEGYLVDKNGYFLQGWAAAPDGSLATGALTSMRVDADAFTSAGAPTSAASLSLNLPADDAAGIAESYVIDVFDSATQQRSLQLSFVKQDANTWSMVVSGGPGDTVTVSPEPVLAFDAKGQLIGQQNCSVNATFADDMTGPTTAAFTLDMSDFTQFAGNFLAYDYTRDGYAPAALSGIEFNESGEVIGRFDNGLTRPLYRLALADFANPDGLAQLSGNIYAGSETSGQAMVAGAGEQGIGQINPGTLEKSNVDLAQEFSRMMLTQNAYNSSATAFRTIDEMTEVARDLA